MLIRPRSEWRPVHGIGSKTPRPQARVVFHHAPERKLPKDPTDEQVAAQIRIMEDWHARTLTPSNPRIGYQFAVVAQTGEVWELLGWDRIGAHVGGHNTASLGILILGVDGAESAGNDDVWRSIGKLLQEGIARGSLVARPELSPHRRYRATSCPGDVLTRHVEQLQLDDLLKLQDEPVIPEPEIIPIPYPDLDADEPKIRPVQPWLRSPAPVAVSKTSHEKESLLCLAIRTMEAAAEDEWVRGQLGRFWSGALAMVMRQIGNALECGES